MHMIERIQCDISMMVGEKDGWLLEMVSLRLPENQVVFSFFTYQTSAQIIVNPMLSREM